MNIRPKILIAFGVPTAVMLISGVITAQALTHSLDTTARVRHTDQVIAAANALIKAAIDTETGERGFVITQTDSFLAPYTDGNITFQSTASQLKVLVSDDPVQLERVDRIVALHPAVDRRGSRARDRSRPSGRPRCYHQTHRRRKRQISHGPAPKRHR